MSWTIQPSIRAQTVASRNRNSRRQVFPGDNEPAVFSVHSGDGDVDRWVRPQDSLSFKCLGFAGLAADTGSDAQGHSVERVVSLWDCQLAVELLGLLRKLAQLPQSSTGPYRIGNILTNSTALVLREGGL